MLDLPLVIRTGLAIADEEGIERLTMRRLFSELGVTPMAIYHHVPNKEALLDLLADEALRALPAVDPTADWEQEVVRLFTAFHHLHLLHPALAYVMTKRPLEGPTAIRLGDRVIGMMIDAGLTEREAVSAFVALNNYTVGTSLYRIVRGSRNSTDAPRFARVAEETAPIACSGPRTGCRVGRRRYAIRRRLDALGPQLPSLNSPSTSDS